MAAVFDGNTKISRAVADPRTDNTLPSPGSLTFPAVATPVALSGTVGADCKLVHGDRWEQLDGSLMELVNVNVTTTIMGNVTRQVTGNQTLTTTGNVTETIVGMLNQTIIAGEMTMCVGPYNRTDVAPVTWLCPTSSQINSGDLYECKVFKGGAYGIRNTNVAVDTAIRGENFQIGIHTTNITQMETKMKVVEAAVRVASWFTVNNLRAGILTAWLNVAGIQGNTRPIQADVGCRIEGPPASLPGVE